MYDTFSYVEIDLENINLDLKNPRIVTREAPKSQDEVISYLFAHEGLLDFIKMIAVEGKNKGAERPYVVPNEGGNYTVVEGNTRIAAYRVLTGLAAAPPKLQSSIPKIPDALRDNLLKVDCTVAPLRSDLLSIMAKSHFGLGDKSKWGYLGSRKAVHDEYESGVPIHELAKAFGLPKGTVRTLILEYKLYLEALKLSWTTKERDALSDPGLEFNPPVRFLQGKGHKEAVGIDYDRLVPEVLFTKRDAKGKYKHLIKRLVVSPEKGLGATASYDQVFANYVVEEDRPVDPDSGQESEDGDEDGNDSEADGAETEGEGENEANAGAHPGLKRDALFNYRVKRANQLLRHLMKEAKSINGRQFPAAATFLLRNIIEVLFKEMVSDHSLNKAGKHLDIESACNLLIGSRGVLTAEEIKILKEFHRNHVDHLNLGAHGNVIPNRTRLMAARDCIDQFVRKYV